MLSEFSFSPVSQSDVLEAFNDLSNKSCGQSPDDGLPSKHLGKLFNLILAFVTYIFNLIILHKKYPQSWKKTFVIPLNKILHPLSFSYTRLISNLTPLAKQFDKLHAVQIPNCLRNNNLLVLLKFASRSDRSQSTLLHLVDQIREGIENGLVTVLVQFDFRTFRHSTLCAISLRLLSFVLLGVQSMTCV